ncbi:hypothetical protein [Streptomyces fractus]|uniref:hypothetical protein n=1 Tax=Streptomyces fractus TaxID=641806 RepID=UPI003CFA9CB4
MSDVFPGRSGEHRRPPGRRFTLSAPRIFLALTLIGAGVLFWVPSRSDGTASASDTGTHASAAASPGSSVSSPSGGTLVDTSGTSSYTTDDFATGANWTIDYTYDCSNLGEQGYFTIDDGVDGTRYANVLGDGGSDSMEASGSGTHSLTVSTSCAWTLKAKGS